MANLRKVLPKARTTPKGLRFFEFVGLIKAFGFGFCRQVGNHRRRARSDVREIINAPPA